MGHKSYNSQTRLRSMMKQTRHQFYIYRKSDQRYKQIAWHLISTKDELTNHKQVLYIDYLVRA